ncbi:hypothetical protein [Pseudobutyrivibrio sp. MD2005]|uniref:hypothetical protein n=1 Tax=Pseudobutyrivibrio sp. MD2005 TaxID=1410616 RepID=UPI0004852D8A|nr:hypothetical protein [Pseudobutyrivibrio sp. MD2005]
MVNDSFSIILDGRTEEDIKKRIAELAKSYVPQWHFDTENPDIGSTIALLYAEQTMSNVKHFNHLLLKYHAQLVNLLGLSLMPAQPSGSVVFIDLIADTMEGTFVPMGTKLLSTETGERVVFETTAPLYVTNSKFAGGFLTRKSDGRVYEFANEFIDELSFEPFPLFDFSNMKAKGEDSVIISHPYIFDVENEDIKIDLIGNESLLSKMRDGMFSFLFKGPNGYMPVSEYHVTSTGVILQKDFSCIGLPEGDEEEEEFEAIAQEPTTLKIISNEPIIETISVDRIDISSTGSPRKMDFVGNEEESFKVENFTPFSDKLDLYKECYINLENYFIKQESILTLEFDLLFDTNAVKISQKELDESLKIIKRKPRNQVDEVGPDVYPDEVTMCYYNGSSWRRLDIEGYDIRMFANGNEGHMKFTFECPSDWQSVDVSGRAGHYIRIQLIQSYNCYMVPSLHHYPIFKNLKCSYDYNNKMYKPKEVLLIGGNETKDVSNEVIIDESVDLFHPSQYNDNALYLCLDKPLSNGPIGLFVGLKPGTAVPCQPFALEYLARDGFKQIQIEDGTHNLSQNGVIRFLPPEDIVKRTIEGREGYWLRLTAARQTNHEIVAPIIQQLKLNAVEVLNIDSQEEQIFYLDEITPNMSFPIEGNNILDIELWVNERNVLTPEQMDILMKTSPDKVKVDVDILGAIQNFYVKWDEVDSLEFSTKEDRHYILNRVTNQVIFGDGLYNKIPTYMDGPAFSVFVRSCDGENGNVSENAINQSVEYLDFIGDITNPIPASGGNNIESFQNALIHGANLLSNSGRLVSTADYIRDITAMSNNIEHVAVVSGVDPYLRKSENRLNIIVLMKDFEKNSLTFQRLAPTIKRHVVENSELTVAEDDVFVVEPLKVKISVDAWIRRDMTEDSFIVMEEMKRVLKEYLNPISSGSHMGWNIGTIPRRKQIFMKLNSVSGANRVERLEVVAEYTDAEGTHVASLEELPNNMFFVVVSGEHRIHTF